MQKSAIKVKSVIAVISNGFCGRSYLMVPLYHTFAVLSTRKEFFGNLHKYCIVLLCRTPSSLGLYFAFELCDYLLFKS